jgi:hypothetical protein
MRWPRSFGLAALTGLGLVACASSGGKSGSSDTDLKRLRAVVIEREYHAPGTSAGGSMRGSGSWFLSLEAQDGEKTVHYHFSVTREQYGRFPEGSRVEILVGDNQLKQIRPVQD